MLQKNDVVRGKTFIRASANQVYDTVSDIRRIPEWSPECVRAEWVAADRFRGSNRRRLGRWSTEARIVTADPGRRFSFAVQMGGSDFTQWTYRMEPAAAGCLLIEEMRMCVDLPVLALLFERLALRVRDRRADLQGNIDQSLLRLRRIVESEHGGLLSGDPR
ncbi:SRPBCC family protein [Mycobacterium sp. GA-2829]|uniref:SRPBCC family protein n=1 Tax=Mycobacterium sp. GA-2829 TaxID=1772283 RepID=UPI0007401239|nr:SRPBCC family protein [Mycobacterium sp. GA-2829]KUI34261.1 hypothetical protein AU194_18125 [Mycobacterium sp. GA-2829]